MQNRNFRGAIFIILLIQFLGFLSGLLSGNIRSDYQNFIKPPLSPPGWLFGLAWIILYTLMGLSIYLIYNSSASQQDKSEAFKLFILQLMVNLIWPVIFFRFELLWVAVIVILILDFLVYLTIKSFWEIDKVASILMIPYLIWILFATYLNIGIALLN